MVDFKSEARFHGQFVPEHKGIALQLLLCIYDMLCLE